MCRVKDAFAKGTKPLASFACRWYVKDCQPVGWCKRRSAPHPRPLSPQRGEGCQLWGGAPPAERGARQCEVVQRGGMRGVNAMMGLR